MDKATESKSPVLKLTPLNRVLLEELTVAQLVNKLLPQISNLKVHSQEPPSCHIIYAAGLVKQNLTYKRKNTKL